MSNMLWLTAALLSFEALFFGNDTAMIASFIMAAMAMFLQKEKA